MSLGPYCVYCLATRNVSSDIRARFPDGTISYPRAPRPRDLARWVAQTEAEHPELLWFELDAMPGAFLAAGTWHGDVVCEIHLLEMIK